MATKKLEAAAGWTNPILVFRSSSEKGTSDRIESAVKIDWKKIFDHFSRSLAPTKPGGRGEREEIKTETTPSKTFLVTVIV